MLPGLPDYNDIVFFLTLNVELGEWKHEKFWNGPILRIAFKCREDIKVYILIQGMQECGNMVSNHPTTIYLTIQKK